MEKYCRNCGNHGHLYHECKNPILSYGIIIYHKDKDDKIEIVMIERKDSLAFIEFMRGKYYNIHNRDYIQLIINRMCVKEKELLLTNNFDDLWKILWGDTNKINNKIKREYSKSKILFNNLKNQKIYNLEYFIKSSTSSYPENEWEIPKGRRENYENNRDCAIREVYEESNISKDKYSLLENIIPINEEYTGINHVRYKHNYYIARVNEKFKVEILQSNTHQISEVKSIDWLNKDGCFNKIRDYDSVKQGVITKFFDFIENIDKYGNLE